MPRAAASPAASPAFRASSRLSVAAFLASLTSPHLMYDFTTVSMASAWPSLFLISWKIACASCAACRASVGFSSWRFHSAMQCNSRASSFLKPASWKMSKASFAAWSPPASASPFTLATASACSAAPSPFLSPAFLKSASASFRGPMASWTTASRSPPRLKWMLASSRSAAASNVVSPCSWKSILASLAASSASSRFFGPLLSPLTSATDSSILAIPFLSPASLKTRSWSFANLFASFRSPLRRRAPTTTRRASAVPLLSFASLNFSSASFPPASASSASSLWRRLSAEDRILAAIAQG
mmetsp:Transcript_117146/g.343171  ORF Transcript_117146/g.343171 Transcript_117146/m.343171 type:complete len:299 (-) Transcript_117146:20-916(-)